MVERNHVKTLAQRANLNDLNEEAWLLDDTLKVSDTFKFNKDIPEKTTGLYENEEYPIHTDKKLSDNEKHGIYWKIQNENNLDFNLTNIQKPITIQKIFPFRYNKNYKQYYKMIQYLTKKKARLDGGDKFHSLCGLTIDIYKDYKKLSKEMNETSENVNKDTLDDSDIENLFNEEEENDDDDKSSNWEDRFTCSNYFTEDVTDPDLVRKGTILPEYDTNSCISNSDAPPESMDDVIDSYLVVGDNAIHLVGSHIIHSMYEFTDLVVFRPRSYPTKENKFTIWDDRILALHKNGIFVSMIMPRMDSDYLRDFADYSVIHPNKVTQIWSLTWLDDNGKIITSEYHNFVCVIQEKAKTPMELFNGITVKLFCWIDAIELRLVNSTIIPSTGTVASCAFIPSNQPTLAVCINENGTNKVSLIQWDTITFEPQEVVILETKIKKTFDPSIPMSEKFSKLIPVSKSHLLLTTKDEYLYLVSLSDIYEKRFRPVELSIAYFSPITSWFYDPDMLKILKSLDVKFDNFDNCTIVFGKEGNLFCILSTNNNEALEIYLIDKEIRGMTSIAPCSNQNLKQPYNFKILGTRFNECTELTINLNKMVKLNRIQEVNWFINFRLPSNSSRQSINFNTICSLVPQYLTEFVPVDSKTEIWITNDDVISQMQPLPFLFTRRTREIGPVIPDFNYFSSINYISGNETLGSRLIWVSDKQNSTKCYALETEYIGEHNNYQFVELEDLLPNYNTKTLFVHVYEMFMVQISTTNICVRSLDDSFETKPIFEVPKGTKISKVEFRDNKLIFWDPTDFKVWCIDDLSRGVDAKYIQITLFQRLIIRHLNISFHIQPVNGNPDKYTILLRNDIGLFSTPWEDFISNNNDNITQVKSIPIDDFVMCNEDLCVFLYHNNFGKPMLRMTNISMDKVVISDRIATVFESSEFVQLKRLNGNTIACYSLNHFFLIFLDDVNNIICEEVTFPHSTINSQVLDLEYDQKSHTMFCLFDNGLHTIELTYLSQSKANHLLPTFKVDDPAVKLSQNRIKIFLYLKKLNRLLIVYPMRHLWCLLKLENGNILKLDDTILKKEKFILQQLVEVEDNAKDTLLLLKFQNCIKYVKITVQNHRLHVEELDHSSTNFLFPKNKIIYNSKRDKFILIQTDRKCKDSDADFSEEVSKITGPEHLFKTSFTMSDLLFMKQAASKYTTFKIINDKLVFDTHEVTLGLVPFISFENYTFFGDYLMFNTTEGMIVYSCYDFRAQIFGGKDYGVKIIKINENMTLAKEIQPDSEDNKYTYEFAFMDKIMKIIHNPEKYWLAEANISIDTEEAIGYNSKMEFEDGQDPDEDEIPDDDYNSKQMRRAKRIWSYQNCLRASLVYYAGDGHSKLMPRFKNTDFVNFKKYIAGLPQIFPKLTPKQEGHFPRSFEMEHIVRTHFDTQHNILYLLTDSGLVHQFEDKPIALLTCNGTLLTLPDLANNYLFRHSCCQRDCIANHIEKRQGFVWLSV